MKNNITLPLLMAMAMSIPNSSNRKQKRESSFLESRNDYKSYSHKDSNTKKHNKKMNKVQRKSRKVNRKKK
jgi:hypothetical protein